MYATENCIVKHIYLRCRFPSHLLLSRYVITIESDKGFNIAPMEIAIDALENGPNHYVVDLHIHQRSTNKIKVLLHEMLDKLWMS